MFRQTTIAKSLDRKRFVTAELAQPYLLERERQNLLGQVRRINAELARAICLPNYGTEARLYRARRVLVLAERNYCAEYAASGVPTPGERKRAKGAATTMPVPAGTYNETAKLAAD
jgi:hypothetical protein